MAVAQQPTPAANLKISGKSWSASTALEFGRALWQEPVGDWMPAHRGEGHGKDGVADVTNVVVHSPRPVQAALPAEKCSSGLGLAISPWAQLFPSLSQTLCSQHLLLSNELLFSLGTALENILLASAA